MQHPAGHVSLVAAQPAGMRAAEPAREPKAIASQPAAVAAFVGRALRGPVNRPVRIQSFAQFQAVFGGLWQPSMLSYALEQFFDNGGESAVVVRVINGGRAPTLSLPTATRPLELVARSPGTREFLRAAVDYDGIAEHDRTTFNLTVQRLRAAGSEHVEDQEIHTRVSIRPEGPRSVAAALAGSLLVQLRAPLPPDRPLPTTRGSGYLASNPDGHDGGQLSDYDLIGSAVESTGLFALTEAVPFNFLCLPPLSRTEPVGPSALMIAGRFCRQRRALLLVDPPPSWDSVDAAVAGVRELPVRGEDAAMFFPRLLAYDRLRARFEPFAPSAAAAGMIARLDRQQPLWGVHAEGDTALRPGLRPALAIDEAARSRLAVLGVNVLQALRGRRRFEARTLAGTQASNSDWRHLSTRRFALYLANCIEAGTRWSAMRLSEPALWASLGSQVGDFLRGLEAEGRFDGGPPGVPWFVVCDGRLNTPGVLGARLLYGFASRRGGDYLAFVVSHVPGEEAVRSVTLNRLHPVLSRGEEPLFVPAGPG